MVRASPLLPRSLLRPLSVTESGKQKAGKTNQQGRFRKTSITKRGSASTRAAVQSKGIVRATMPLRDEASYFCP